MLGLTDDLVAGCVATIDCHGAEHRLAVRGHALVALDHQSEAAKVLDALTDEVSCLELVAGWDALRRRYTRLGPHPYLMPLSQLIRADVTVAEHEEWLAAERVKAQRLSQVLRRGGLPPGAASHGAVMTHAHAQKHTMQLPDPLRLYLGLIAAAHASAADDLPDAHARRLAGAVAACVASWREHGYPPAEARVRVLLALRGIGGSPRRWGEAVQLKG